ncbi:MAG: ribulose-phosphate 3-epimerase [Bacteroidales bacterium]|nr:ribulose-phosphate 3-epimerase [Bacteroidales bacterium]
MTRYIAPSILAADFANLQKEIEIINASKADFIHCDIMDGVYVPNISFGLPVVEAVKRHAQKPLDVHLMIVEPERYLKKFRDAGAFYLTVHQETCMHLHSTVTEIKKLGMKAGVSLNPHTPVNTLEEIINDVDMVLIMTVNPGFGGQEFIPRSYEKIRKLKALIESSGSHALIEVDGGVDLTNAGTLFETGVNVLVTGTTIFESENPAETIRQLKNTGR